METNRVFEIGSIIISRENDFEKIDKTLRSIKEQTVISRKIIVLSLSNKNIENKDRIWINKRTQEFKSIGAQDFKFVDMILEGVTIKEAVTHVYRQSMDKPMRVKIHTPTGDRDGKVRVTHFSTIKAGEVYESDQYFQTIKEMFSSDKKSFVVYSNYFDEKVNLLDITDEHPLTFHSYTYGFFVPQSEEENIVDCYLNIRKKRLEAKKLDKETNNVDDESYSDIIFAKTAVGVVR